MQPPSRGVPIRLKYLVSRMRAVDRVAAGVGAVVVHAR